MKFEMLLGPSDCSAEMPYTDIASSVLIQAIADWRKYGYMAKMTKNEPYRDFLKDTAFNNPRQELLEFFHSGWCEFLVCAVIDLPYEVFLKEIGVPK